MSSRRRRSANDQRAEHLTMLMAILECANTFS
jgi:hypothetical protein